MPRLKARRLNETFQPPAGPIRFTVCSAGRRTIGQREDEFGHQMDLTGIGLFNLADKRLGYLDQRQGLLAQDVANLDTPGWVDKDLEPFAAELSQFAPAATPVMTNPMHLPGTTGGAQGSSARPHARSLDGNTVDLSTELTKIASSDNAHELVTDLYKKYLGMFKTALGRSS